jgi:hypothetical protein
MKRLLLLILLSSSASAEEARTTLPGKWEYLAKNESGSLFYIDTSRITDVEGRTGAKRFWLLVDKETKQLESQMEVSCTDDTLLSGPEYQYKKSGALLLKITEWDEEPTPIGEGSVLELVRNYLCNP